MKNYDLKTSFKPFWVYREFNLYWNMKLSKKATYIRDALL